MSESGRHRFLRAAVSVAAVVSLSGGLAACAGDDAERERLRAQEIATAKAEARREALAEQRGKEAAAEAKRLRRDIDKLKSERARSRSEDSRQDTAPDSSPDASRPTQTPRAAGSTSCENGLSVNSVTSCSFARSVRNAYEASGGASSIDAFSPVTGQTYTMRCSGAIPVVCTGGNSAAVYIR